MAEDLSNLQLPIELLYHVMSYVGDLSTLQNLSLTSKVWNNIANRKLWKHFKIHTQSFSTHVMECVCENGSLYQGNQRNRTITYKQAASYERINAPDIYQCDIFADDEQKLFDNSVSPSYSFMTGRSPNPPTNTNGISYGHMRLLIYTRLSIRDFQGQHLLRLSSI